MTSPLKKWGWFVILLMMTPAGYAAERDLVLPALIDEALKGNPEILASEARLQAARYRIPQASSLPDPALSAGYQNEGIDKYAYGTSPDAKWMFSLSQMFPYPGKRALREGMSARDADGLAGSHEALKLRVASRIKELHADLYLSYKTLEVLRSRSELLNRIESLSLARYASGVASQQDVTMAQIEKYMQIEREEMERRRIAALEVMLNQTLWRDPRRPLGKPADLPAAPFFDPSNEIFASAVDRSPEIRSKAGMIDAAQARFDLARKEVYPDFSLSANYEARGREFKDMWGLTAGINLPVYYAKKQSPGISEAAANLAAAKHEKEASRIMLLSSIGDSMAMIRAAERLMRLYRDGLIPKTNQEIDLLVAVYAAGKGDMPVLIGKFKSLLDYELAYWQQFVDREKAVARIEAITGPISALGGDEK